MGVILILIIASLTVALGFLFAFMWSVNKGQYDDVETPAIRILFDEGLVKSKSLQSKKSQKNIQESSTKKEV